MRSVNANIHKRISNFVNIYNKIIKNRLAKWEIRRTMLLNMYTRMVLVCSMSII